MLLDILVQLLLGQRDIAAGGLDIGVTEHLLERAQGRAGLDHVGRHRVPQRVRRGVLDPGDRQVLVKEVLNGPRRERLAVLGDEEGGRLGFRPNREIGPQRPADAPVQGEPAILAPLALADPEFPQLPAFLGRDARQLDVAQLEFDEFADPDPGLEHQLDDRGHARPTAHGVPQASVLGFGEHPGFAILAPGRDQADRRTVFDVLVFLQEAEEGFEGVGVCRRRVVPERPSRSRWAK